MGKRKISKLPRPNKSVGRKRIRETDLTYAEVYSEVASEDHGRDIGSGLNGVRFYPTPD